MVEIGARAILKIEGLPILKIEVLRGRATRIDGARVHCREGFAYRLALRGWRDAQPDRCAIATAASWLLTPSFASNALM